LRDTNAALANGHVVPLTASNDAVAAYARRDGDRVVLVVANLGASLLRGVSLSAAEGSLPPGRWRLRPLIGAAAATTLTVDASGKVEGYVPLRSLRPTQGYLFELQRP